MVSFFFFDYIILKTIVKPNMLLFLQYRVKGSF